MELENSILSKEKQTKQDTFLYADTDIEFSNFCVKLGETAMASKLDRENVEDEGFCKEEETIQYR